MIGNEKLRRKHEPRKKDPVVTDGDAADAYRSLLVPRAFLKNRGSVRR
jgi:hypothetical protein